MHTMGSQLAAVHSPEDKVSQRSESILSEYTYTSETALLVQYSVGCYVPVDGVIEVWVVLESLVKDALL